jgi:hypothetical protein
VAHLSSGAATVGLGAGGYYVGSLTGLWPPAVAGLASLAGYVIPTAFAAWAERRQPGDDESAPVSRAEFEAFKREMRAASPQSNRRQRPADEGTTDGGESDGSRPLSEAGESSGAGPADGGDAAPGQSTTGGASGVAAIRQAAAEVRQIRAEVEDRCDRMIIVIDQMTARVNGVSTGSSSDLAADAVAAWTEARSLLQQARQLVANGCRHSTHYADSYV